MTVRTRFSPSPTGMIHLGNARAALFSALFAAKHKGVFVLRIEDTDATRSDVAFTEILKTNLHWLDIYWQEGPDIGGEYGPYLQSARQAIYQDYYHQLEAKHLIYPCFCSDQELLLQRKVQLSRGQAPRYAGTCRKLSATEIEERLASGKKPAWRFEVPKQQKIEFVDLVKGPQAFLSDDIGDFIVRRADGTAPFLFCNAIDDTTMKVTHVLRGEDHLPNTPRQLMLLQALQLPIPEYGHLSLILGDDGTPLSKRHGSFSVQDMQTQGFLPIAVINYLARLGHICNDPALLPFAELANQFNTDTLSKSPARFDKTQLMYWQKSAIQTLTPVAFWEWIGPEVAELVTMEQRELFVETIKGNIEFPEEARVWARVFFGDELTLDLDAEHVIQSAGPEFFVMALEAFTKHGIDIPKVLAHIKDSLNVNGKSLFMPLRVALTGRLHGPELVAIARLLGSSRVDQRLKQAEKLAKNKAL